MVVLGLAIHRPHADMCPVRLGLITGIGLEADLGLAHHRRPEQTQLPLERGIAAGEAVLLHQLVVQVGAPDARAGGQAPLHMDPLRRRQLRGLVPRVLRRSIALQLTPHRVAAHPELPGQRAHRPSVTVQGFQFHPRFSRLQTGSPFWASASNTGSLSGDFSFFKPSAPGCLAKIRDQVWLVFVLTHIRWRRRG